MYVCRVGGWGGGGEKEGLCAVHACKEEDDTILIHLETEYKS